MPVVAGKLKCDVPMPGASGETHTTQTVVEVLPAEVVFKVETKHFYCKFYCRPVEVFLTRFAGDLPMACRVADRMEGSTASDYFGHCWDPNISPAAATAR